MDIVLPLLVSPVAVARAATFHLCLGPCLRTANCRHRGIFLDQANPHYIGRIHPMTHCYLDTAAESHVEDCYRSAPLDFSGHGQCSQDKDLEKIHTKVDDLGGVVFVGRHMVAADCMP